MTCFYSNKNLYEEKRLVIDFFTKKSQKNRYPHSYTMGIYSYINEMYDLYLVTPDYLKLNNELVQQAINFATTSHQHQVRKYFHLPYIVHPLEMASYLSQFSHITAQQLAASILHDVVEDCSVSSIVLKKQFGEIVAQQVYFLTDPSDDSNREKRMTINFQHLLKADPAIYDIKIVDLLSNTRSILFCDCRFASIYMIDMEKITAYFNEYSLAYPHIIHVDLLEKLNKTLFLAKKILYLQKQFNIVKLDK